MSRSKDNPIVLDDSDDEGVFHSATSSLPPRPGTSQSQNYCSRVSTPSSPGTLRGDSPLFDMRELDRLSLEPPTYTNAERRFIWTPSSQSEQSATPSSSIDRKRRRDAELAHASPTPPSRRERRQPCDTSTSFRRSQAPSVRPPQDASSQPAVDLTQDEYIDLSNEEEELQQQDIWEAEEAKLQGLSRIRSANTSPLHSIRNPPIEKPLLELTRIEWKNNSFLDERKTIELKNGDFLKIVHVIKNTVTLEITLRGILLKRNEYFNGLLSENHNELCAWFDVDLDDSRALKEQALFETGIEQVERIRKVVFTNDAYPKHNNTEYLRKIRQIEGYPASYITTNVVLVCRRKLISRYKTATYRQHIEKCPSHFFEREIMALNKDECSPGAFAPPEELRSAWRGDTVSGGSSLRAAIAGQGGKKTFVDMTEGDRTNSEVKTTYKKEAASCQIFRNAGRSTVRHSPLSSQQCTPGKSTQNQRDDLKQAYTFGDAFCGCGGMSSGAVRAGLKLLWGLDFNPKATQTWEENFAYATLYEMWVDQFVKLNASEPFIVDILHLSPPCQPFSPAHTRQGQDDDMNRDSFLAVEEILKKTKPRMATLEETFGLLHHQTYFNALICMITSLGFSVRWKVVALKEFGLPQERRRLIIIASCPGETLPPFPEPTHSQDGGRDTWPYATPREILHQIPRNALNNERRPGTARVRPVLPPSKLMPTITTNATVPHPDGMGDCTARQIAALNGFFNDHIFVGTWTAIRKQIGNAVPPIYGKILMKSIIRHLKDVDQNRR